MNHVDAIKKVIIAEGGSKYTNHPADRGGPTKYGITLRTLSQWRKKTCTADDVKNLTEAEAIQIYKAFYWDLVMGDSIKSYAVAVMLFDQAVNRGISSAVKQAQKVAGVIADGVMGPGTLKALNSIQESSFVKSYAAASRSFYESLVTNDPSQSVFLKGWLNRVAHLESYANSVSGKIILSTGMLLVVGMIFFLILNSSPKRKTA